MAVFYASPSSIGYHYLDICLGLLSLLLFLFSTLLNLIVLGFNHSKRTNSSILYRLLAAAYICSTLHAPLMTYHFLQSSSTLPLQPTSTLPPPLLVISSLAAALGINIGGGTLTLLGGLRLFTLRSPLRVVKRRVCVGLVGVVVAVSLAETCLQLLYSLESGPGISFNFNTRKQFLTPPEYYGDLNFVSVTMKVVYLLNCALNIGICCWTSYALCPRRAQKRVVGTSRGSGLDAKGNTKGGSDINTNSDTKLDSNPGSCLGTTPRKAVMSSLNGTGRSLHNIRYSSFTILYMCVIYTLILLYTIVVVVLIYLEPASARSGTELLNVVSFVAYPFLPLTMALTNPSLLIARGREMRDYVGSMVRRVQAVRALKGCKRNNVSGVNKRPGTMHKEPGAVHKGPGTTHV